MQRRLIGKSGIEASVVGLGAWAIGGWAWGGMERGEAIRTIHAALDSGIDLIDTAPMYGFGLSEEIIGKALQDRRDRAVVATKCGLVCGGGRGKHFFNTNALSASPHGHVRVYRYLAPDSIRDEVEASLKRLKTDVIDLYQTHWQDPTTPIERTMETLMELKREGKIRAIGVSNATASQMSEYAKAGRLDSDQEKFSMLDRKIEEDQLPYCRKHQIAMLAYSPLAQGLLTEKVDPDREYGEGDQRRHHARFSRENRERMKRIVEEKFKPVAERHGVTVSQLTIAWTAHQPGVTHVLCGAHSAEQAETNAAAGGLKLSDSDIAAISEAIEQHTAAPA